LDAERGQISTPIHTKIVLKGGGAGSAMILVKGRDGNLDLTPSTLPFDSSSDVTVQLTNADNSNCWQASFSPASVQKSIGAQFKAKLP
jgi:hypothetical protein